VTVPAVTLPAVTIPGFWLGGHWYPPQHYPAQHYPAQHFPAQSYPAQRFPAQRYPPTCFNSPAAPAPSETTVRVRNYGAIDRRFSPDLSSIYWRRAGPTVSFPNVYAWGYGGLNAAGFPKSQYVRSYIRRDGTYVNGVLSSVPVRGVRAWWGELRRWLAALS